MYSKHILYNRAVFRPHQYIFTLLLRVYVCVCACARVCTPATNSDPQRRQLEFRLNWTAYDCVRVEVRRQPWVLVFIPTLRQGLFSCTCQDIWPSCFWRYPCLHLATGTLGLQTCYLWDPNSGLHICAAVDLPNSHFPSFTTRVS